MAATFSASQHHHSTLCLQIACIGRRGLSVNAPCKLRFYGYCAPLTCFPASAKVQEACEEMWHGTERPISQGSCQSRLYSLTERWIPIPNVKRNITIKALQSQVTSSSNGAYLAGQEQIAIVWFKKDLRIDDHPGLVAAISSTIVAPVYIFDPEILAGWPSDLLEELLEAVVDLRSALQTVGSDLIIRSGRTDDVLFALVQEIKCTVIITEQEIEHDWSKLVSSITKRLEAVLRSGKPVEIKYWKAPLYELECEDLPCSYRDFQSMKFSVIPPLESLRSLPPLPGDVDRGVLPSMANLEEEIEQVFIKIGSHESFQKVRREAPEKLLEVVESTMERVTIKGRLFEGFSSWRERYILANPYADFEERKRELMTSGDVVKRQVSKTGTLAIMNALDGYFRFLEPTWRDDWKQIHEQVLETEVKRGASFRSIFGNALILGTVSHRRVYYEALEYEKARSGGWISPFGFSAFTAAAAVEDIRSIEWHRMLATVSQKEAKERGWHARTWCWRGFLILYNTLGSEGPPIVLVHGFGAFGEHYRDNIKGLAERGNRVWALTLLGFGRSEKPNIFYTEFLWAELIRDFILEVVQEPTILVGNSIGGYIVSSVAGLWPSIVKSLILLNTAGAVIPDYLSLKYLKPREKSGLAWAGSRLLLLYLRGVSTSLLKKCYPMKPWRADKWLSEEVARASYDPGAVVVLESLFHLRRPLPINYFIDRYKKKVFVIQGFKDPLSRFSRRAKMLKSFCKNVVVSFLDAGHCPHDELPDEVNSLIINWIHESGLLKDDLAMDKMIEKVGM